MAYERASEAEVESVTLTRALLGFGALAALVATAGSLYLSFGLGLIPCELCWYQRILMYPLVVVLGVACIKGRASVYHTVFPLAALGAIIAAYHSYIQIYPQTTRCTVGCSTVQYTTFGLSIPNLSLAAFGLVLLAMGALYHRYKTAQDW